MTYYLIDSNSFIEPYRRYYSFDIMPSFWLNFEKSYNDSIFLIEQVKSELCFQKETDKKDELQLWIEAHCLSTEKLIKPHLNQAIIMEYRNILQFIQDASCYNEKSFEEWAGSMEKADPWLIATAKVLGHTIITMEQRNGNLSDLNPTSKEPRIPDVSDAFGVQCINLFDWMRRESIII